MPPTLTAHPGLSPPAAARRRCLATTLLPHTAASLLSTSSFTTAVVLLSMVKADSCGGKAEVYELDEDLGGRGGDDEDIRRLQTVSQKCVTVQKQDSQKSKQFIS